MRHQNLAGVVALMGIITAEPFRPGYSTRDEAISDLGASMLPESVALQPSATIFNATMILTGLLVITGALILFGAAGGVVLRIDGPEGWVVAYPVVLWTVGFGGYLMGSSRPGPDADSDPQNVQASKDRNTQHHMDYQKVDGFSSKTRPCRLAAFINVMKISQRFSNTYKTIIAIPPLVTTSCLQVIDS